MSLLSNGRRRQFIFVFLHLIPETSRPGGGCSDKCLEFFGQFCTDKQTSCKTILFECRKSRATLGYCRKSLFSISFQFIRHTKVCRVFFFCCCYGLCLNQPKMSAYLTSFARLARLYTVIAICNIALSVYYQFFAFKVLLLPVPLLRAL